MKNNVLTEIRNYSLPILLATIPFLGVFYTNLTLSVTTMICIGLLLTEQSSISFNSRKLNSVYIIFITFFLICLIFCINSIDSSKSFKSLEKYYSLVLFPILVLNSKFNKKRIHLFIVSFIIITLIITLISIGRLIWFVNRFSEWIEKMRIVNGNDTYLQFKYPHLMRDAHPSYWSILLLFSTIMVMYLMKYSNKINRYLGLFLILTFAINLFYLSSRILIGIYLLIIPYIISQWVFNIKLIYPYLFMLILIIIAYFYFPFIEYKMNKVLSDNRFYLWNYSIKNIVSNGFVSGNGLGTSKQVLSEYLNSTIDVRKQYKGVEVHNQYLKTLMDTGLLGLSSLLTLYLFPIYVYIKNQGNAINYLLLVLSLVFVIVSLFEPIFSVVKGVILFVIIFSIIYKYNLDEAK